MTLLLVPDPFGDPTVTEITPMYYCSMPTLTDPGMPGWRDHQAICQATNALLDLDQVAGIAPGDLAVRRSAHRDQVNRRDTVIAAYLFAIAVVAGMFAFNGQYQSAVVGAATLLVLGFLVLASNFGPLERLDIDWSVYEPLTGSQHELLNRQASEFPELSRALRRWIDGRQVLRHLHLDAITRAHATLERVVELRNAYARSIQIATMDSAAGAQPQAQ
jgi:hypothetical protein